MTLRRISECTTEVRQTLRDIAVKVLVVEEEKQVIKDIAFCLAVRYPQSIVVSSSKWQKGINLIENELPDLIIISSSLHDIDANDLINKIRQYSDAPLLVLIEGASDIDRAIVLEAGADDYIPKPFSPIELLARVTALLRRTYHLGFKQAHSLCAGKLTINFNTREVFLSDQRIRLTPREYSLLLELVQNEGRVLPNSLLLEKVWGSEYTADSTFIKKYIYRLRCKLEQDPENPQMLLSEWGIGYRFVRPVS
jgi:two-component system KDP operon response regulator KdpE